jgi:dTDP-4-dehydrorhamnose reductase
LKNRILLTGARGMFGSDGLAIFSEKGFEVIPRDLPELDITDASSLKLCFDDVKPQIVINAAAFTDVDGAESRKTDADRVNGDAVKHIAGLCAVKNVFLVHISTDYVFPGTKKEGYLPSDEAGPAVSAYGESKLEGEKQIVNKMKPSDYLICRTQWLYGKNGKNFVNTIAKLAGEKETLEIVDDQWGVPTWTKDLAEQIDWLMENKITGFAHTVGGGGPVTWHTFGKEIVSKLGLKCKVLPMSSDRLDRPAKRPQYGWLRNDSIPINGTRDWKESLSMYLKEEKFL